MKALSLGAMVVVVAALAVFPVAWGKSSGAGAGFSGGPTGSGQNCTACHQPFNAGPGTVEILGVPQRYRVGNTYDLVVRVSDAGRDGAGFEISAENGSGHVGQFFLSDFISTRYASGAAKYVTHSITGFGNSLTNWVTNGASVDYSFQWQAPATDAGRVTFFASGAAVIDPAGFATARYYATHAIASFATPGDGDGDTDFDLLDFALLQRCFSGNSPLAGAECTFVDINDDTTVSLEDAFLFVTSITGPTVIVPAAFTLADAVRGGKLYDKWWAAKGAPAPTGNHPLYPPIGQQTGAATFRCKECHGWDYKGVDGAYGDINSSHYTGIKGIFQTGLSPQAVFDLLKADPADLPQGHNMTAYGLTDIDLWNLTRMVMQNAIDTNTFIDGNGNFVGTELFGQLRFADLCGACHGAQGLEPIITSGETVGGVANANPWEFLHKVRFGHPGSPMPSFVLLGDGDQLAADVGVYAATLPTQ